MISFKQLGRSIAGRFGYDAAGENALRKQPLSTLKGEDDELPAGKRQKLVARARDLRRNFSAARWAINTHLDFVSSFRFRPFTGVKAFDREIEAFVDGWSADCDVTGRFSLRKLVRLAEGLRVVDGDLLVIKLADGRLQVVEGDRVRNPTGTEALGQKFDLTKFVHGVQLDPQGRPVAYAIHKRASNGFVFERLVPAANVLHFGYFDRIDQVRGISPAAAGLNLFRDVGQNYDYALQRAKLSQMCGLVIKRKQEDTLPDIGEDPEGGLEAPDAAQAFTWDPDSGPMQIDLDVDENASLLESNTPSSEFQAFNAGMIELALKSLDLPMSFYDTGRTNFFGSRAGLQLYLKSAEPKRDDVRELLDKLTRWRISLAVMDGRLNPAKHGLTLDRVFWKWTPVGFPWWDGRDVRADLMAVHAGFKTRSSVIEEKTGETFEDVVDRLAEEQAYLKDRGISIEAPMTTLFAPEPAPADATEA